MRSQKSKIKNRKLRSGVTLTEVVVASGLLLIAVVPILRALTIARITARVIERKTRSLTLAQRELERLRAESLYHYDDSLTEVSRVLEEGFLCSTTDDGDANLKLVAVSVGHDENGDRALGGDEIDIRLSTYLARRWPGP